MFFCKSGTRIMWKKGELKYDLQTDQGDRNPSSFFLRPMEGKEIIKIVLKCESKTSTIWNDIDMMIVEIYNL